ncbi:hypothetical protein [Kitasatospora sp. NPDC085879]|uniref:hypothetical protein n=1 Tax=Kitasatospora sp. NPDC085879 TaxID=3154769 RepID=UPI0034281D6B
MLALGLLLLAATGAFTGLLIAENLDGGPTTTVTMFGNDLATMNSLAIFLAGIALTLLFVLACLMVLMGRRRARRRGAELRASRRAGARGVPGGAVPADPAATQAHAAPAAAQPYADRAPLGGGATAPTGPTDTRAQSSEARQAAEYQEHHRAAEQAAEQEAAQKPDRGPVNRLGH